MQQEDTKRVAESLKNPENEIRANLWGYIPGKEKKAGFRRRKNRVVI